MCLFVTWIDNPRYKKNKKNGGNPPPVTHQDTKQIPVPCGRCVECMKQKANNWRIRLTEEYKTDKTGKFVTMTFSEESLIELEQVAIKEAEVELEGYDLENDIARVGVRKFLERHRKQYGKSIKHWLITELGQEATERIHIHGILYTSLEKAEIEKLWKYGNVNKRDKTWKGTWCNEQTINYIIKYVHKTDLKHKAYKAKIFTSSGIGRNWINSINAQRAKYKEGETKEWYLNRQGYKMSLPVYYRNKLYTDEEKQKLWIKKLDEKIIWVRGKKIDISQNMNDYDEAIRQGKIENTQLGFGGILTEKQKQDENNRRNIQRKRRVEKQYRKIQASNESNMGKTQETAEEKENQERRKFLGEITKMKNDFETQRGVNHS